MVSESSSPSSSSCVFVVCLFVVCSLFTLWIRAEPLIYINYIIIIYYCIFRSEGRGGQLSGNLGHVTRTVTFLVLVT